MSGERRRYGVFDPDTGSLFTSFGSLTEAREHADQCAPGVVVRDMEDGDRVVYECTDEMDAAVAPV